GSWPRNSSSLPVHGSGPQHFLPTPLFPHTSARTRLRTHVPLHARLRVHATQGTRGRIRVPSLCHPSRSQSAMETWSGSRPCARACLGLFLLVAAHCPPHARAEISCASCRSPVRLHRGEFPPGVRADFGELGAEDARPRTPEVPPHPEHAPPRARRSASTRPEEPRLSSSTFALAGDSAHNHAVVYWSGRNSSVSPPTPPPPPPPPPPPFPGFTCAKPAATRGKLRAACVVPRAIKAESELGSAGPVKAISSPVIKREPDETISSWM
ncbi:unnamed protein product, partial [Menidia menidia]